MLKIVAEKLYREKDRLVEKMVDQYIKTVPSFSRLSPTSRAELSESLQYLVALISKFIEREGENQGETYAFSLMLSEANFMRNIPFDDLINSFYIGESIVWSEVIKDIREEDFSCEEWAKLFAIKSDLEGHLIPALSSAYIADKERYIARQIRELTGLIEVGKTITSTIDLDLVLKQILEVSTSLMQKKMGAIFLLDKDTGELELEAALGLSRPWTKGFRIDLTRSLLQKALESKRPEAAVEEELKGLILPILPGGRRVRSLLSCPILIGDVPIGGIELYDDRPHVYQPLDITLLATFAPQAGVAIRNARLFYTEERRRQQALLSKELAEDVARAINFFQAAGIVVHKLAEVAGVDRCTLFSFYPDTQEIELLRGFNLSERERKFLKGKRWRVTEIDDITQRVALKGEIMVVDDAPSSPMINQAVVKRFNIRSCLMLPLIYRDQVTGLVYLDHTKKRHHFDRDEVEMIRAITTQAAVALEHIKLRESIHYKEMALKEAEANKELYKERERSEAIINASPDAIILIDRNCTIVEFNPAAERLTGWRTTEAIGRSCHEVFYGRPYNREECQALDCNIARALKGEIADLKEKLYTRPDGSQVWIGGSFSVLRDTKRRIQNVIAVFRDITEQKKLEDLHLWERELKVARETQTALLPSDHLEDRKVRIKAHLQQAREVGGDWYDYWIEDGRLSLVIGDASGMGMPAALKATVAMGALRAEARRSRDMLEIVQGVNFSILSHQQDDSFVSLFYGEIDLDSLVFRYVNAGHFDPILVRKGRGGQFLPCRHRLILGAFERPLLSVEEVKLEEGDRLFLYTDGLVESRNPHRVQFGINRLIRYINANSSRTREALVDDLIKRLFDFTAGNLEDDITVIVCDLI